jgi:hypothetical protein
MTMMRRATRNITLGSLGDGETATIPFPQVSPDYTPSPTTYPTYPTSSGSSFDYNALVTNLTNIAKPILNAQWGGPQPGQYLSYNAKTGQYTNYALPTGQSTNISTFPGISLTSSGLSSWIPIILLGIVGAFAIRPLFK